MIKVMHYISKMNRGGQETFIMNLYRNIDRDKVQFEFLCTEPGIGDYDAEIKELGGKIFHIDLNCIKGKIKQLDNARRLYKYLKKRTQEIQVFHIHTQHAMEAFFSSLAAKLAGVKVVIVHSHNTSSLFHVKAHKIFKYLLNVMPIERFACSEAAGKWMFGNHKFRIINNGIDVDKFKFEQSVRKKIREKMGWKDNYIIGHVGRFNAQKNHQFLIEIFNEVKNYIPEAKLILVGTGELQENIRKHVEKLKLEDKVEFLGMREDVNRLYQGMDIMCFPSLFEGLPVVLVEAQESGLSCVISETITKEIDITKLLYRVSLESDSKVWCNKICELKKYMLDRSDMTTDIRNSGYDMKEEAKEIQKIYREKVSSNDK
ncbi:Mannosylfructose-phosphate synthase [uncultured Clostridium sp.]|nr:Mannosylfructose-phosphate synthase [uncultured Clostridium sp.]